MFKRSQHYKLLYTISNNIEVFEEPVPQTEKSVTVQLNSRPVRGIELQANVCTMYTLLISG